MMEMLELRDKVLTLPALEKRMVSMKRDIRDAEDEVSRLLRQYESESRDVERMQRDSFSAFLFRLIGKYEDKLEKEQQEEINAKITYDRATTHFNNLVQEKDELVARISELKADERVYQSELENRRRELSGKLSEPNGIRYAELEDERYDMISEITEIKEALRAANRAVFTAGQIANSLNGAEGWATFDAFTNGGILSHIAKYSHIDEAEKNFSVLSHNLRELKSELRDVRGIIASGLHEISSGQRIVDFWFDNIFTDLSVRSQIKDNAGQINDLINNINQIESKLKAKLREAENELASNKRSEEELLLSISS